MEAKVAHFQIRQRKSSREHLIQHINRVYPLRQKDYHGKVEYAQPQERILKHELYKEILVVEIEYREKEIQSDNRSHADYARPRIAYAENHDRSRYPQYKLVFFHTAHYKPVRKNIKNYQRKYITVIKTESVSASSVQNKICIFQNSCRNKQQNCRCKNDKQVVRDFEHLFYLYLLRRIYDNGEREEIGIFRKQHYPDIDRQ